MKEEIKKRIEKKAKDYSGDIDDRVMRPFIQQDFYMGAEFAVSLMQEEVEKWKGKYNALVQEGAKRGAYTILNQTIESQSKEIAQLKEAINLLFKIVDTVKKEPTMQGTVYIMPSVQHYKNVCDSVLPKIDNLLNPKP